MRESTYLKSIPCLREIYPLGIIGVSRESDIDVFRNLVKA